jgi:hypothetical protein
VGKLSGRRLPIRTSKEVGLEVHIDKTKYIVTCTPEGRRYCAALLSLLCNRGRIVAWIRSPLGIVALHGNEQ